MSDIYELMNTIKRMAVEASEAEEPVGVDYGVVKSVDPFVIDMGDYTIEDELIVLTRTIKNYIKSGNVKKGDCVACLSEQGGESWLVLDIAEVEDDD